MWKRARHAGQLDAEAAGHLPHLDGDQALRAADALVDGGDDQVLDHLDVLRVEQRRLDANADHLELAVDRGRDHAAAGAGLDGAARELVLDVGEPLLELLRLLEDATEVEALAHLHTSYGRRRSRTPRTSAPKISTAAFTIGCASVS